MNYGMMKHSTQEGTRNLRRKLRDRIKHNIDKVDGISGGTKVALKQSVMSDVDDLEQIALQKGQRYYDNLHEGDNVLKLYCLDLGWRGGWAVLATTLDAAYNIIQSESGGELAEKDKSLFEIIHLEQGKSYNFIGDQ